jgi:hypothetical protein
LQPRLFFLLIPLQGLVLKIARKGSGGGEGRSIIAGGSPLAIVSGDPAFPSGAEVAGVGINLDFKNGKLLVKKLQEGGAAARSGKSMPPLFYPVNFFHNP